MKIFIKKIDDMNVQELQQVIDYASEKSSLIVNRSTNGPFIDKVGWYAAAQIAKYSGYPLAATLVEKSVVGEDYYEENAPFAKAIRNTNCYKKRQNGAMTYSFEKSESPDLFFGLHSVYCIVYQNSITINDKFDFKYDRNLKGLFTKLVNNFAYLEQQIYVLYPSDIVIRIY